MEFFIYDAQTGPVYMLCAEYEAELRYVKNGCLTADLFYDVPCVHRVGLNFITCLKVNCSNF